MTASGDDLPVLRTGAWPDLADARLLRFLRCWAQWREGRPVSPRSAVDPILLGDCLSHVWLQYWDADRDDFVCVIAGESVRDAWGETMANRTLGEWAPADRAGILRRRWRRMLDVPAIAVSRSPIEPVDAAPKKVDRVAVPLLDREDLPAFIFGMSVYYYDVHQAKPQPSGIGDIAFYACDSLPADPP
jgi:hypothetical protein